MDDKDIIRAAIADRGTTQKEVAEKMGKENQQYIGNMLMRKTSMRVDNFVKVLNAMGYDVVVKPNIGKGKEWTVKF